MLETPQIQSNYKQDTVNRLPMARTPTAQANLTPGVTAGVNGPTISGAMSYDNLYLVNGAVVNENLRGQTGARPLHRGRHPGDDRPHRRHLGGVRPLHRRRGLRDHEVGRQ